MHFIKKTFFKRFCAGLAAAALMFWICGDFFAREGISVFAEANAAGTGDFTVTGGTMNTDYTYADGVLTITSETALTISGTSTTDRIEVASGVNANITLSGVNIDVSGTSGAAAFKIADNSNGSVAVTLEGTNTLTSGANCAGLQKNGNSGTLTITGTGSLTAQGGNQAAGIGGGKDGSGTGICITGGTINAKGGSTRAWLEDGSVSGSFGGAGIGGGLTGSGTVTISGSANVTAQGGAGAAGIGSGRCSSISNDASGTVTIEGGTVIATGGLTPGFSGSSGAGIGAGISSHANVTITGGTVTAAGGSSGRGKGYGGAGIGSSSGLGNATVKISGGTVKAKGGDDKHGGAGIGGGSGTGYAANVMITGGLVTATGGSDVSSDGSGKSGAGIGLSGGGNGSATFSTTGDSGAGDAFIIAMGGTGNTPGDGITNGVSSAWNGLIVNGEATVWGVDSYTLSQTADIPGGVTLTIPNGKTLTVNSTLTNNGTLRIDGGTLNGAGTLSGSGSFVTTTLTEDMITIPTGLVYNGSDLIKAITEQTKAVTTICGREFGVTGWTLSVTKNSDLEYAVTYTNGSETVSKRVTVGQSETGIKVTTYKDSTETTDFTYGDTVTVKAEIAPTGTSAAAKAARLRGAPAAMQAAVFYGETQITDPVTVTDGAAEFSFPTKDIGAGEKTFTVKFTGNDNMADKAVDFTVDIAPFPLEVIAVSLEDKIYDGTTDANRSAPMTLNIDDMGLLLVYDATIEYTSPDAGTDTVYVTLEVDDYYKNNYTLPEGGRYTVTVDKAIQKAAPTADMFTFTAPENNVYTGNAILPTVTPNDDIAGMGEVTVAFDENNSSPLTDGKPVNTGTYYTKISVAEGKNYTAENIGGDMWKFDIAPAPIENVSAELSETAYVYNGLEHIPTVTLTYNGMTLEEGKDYDIVPPEDTVNKGEKTITITGNGNYTGTLEVTYRISSGIYDPTVPSLTAVYGDTLADVELPADDKGKWAWADDLSTSVGNAGINRFEAIFTPDDENIEPVTEFISVTVEKADPIVTPPDPITVTYIDGMAVRDIPLPANWVWVDGSSTNISVGTVNIPAQYIPADSANYNTVTADITVIFEECSHTVTTPRTDKAPNCTEDGLIEYVCDFCKKVVSTERIPAVGHTEDGGTVTVRPTAESTGVRTYYCTVCGAELRTEIVPVLEPGHVHSFGAAWNCNISGHWQECFCGEKSGLVPHTEDFGTVTVQPTVESEGIKVFRCAVCGFKIREEVIPRLEPEHTHIYGTVWFSDSTGHWHECMCGEKADLAPHTEDIGTVTVYPTETTAGTRTFKCTACGYVMRTEAVPPTGYRPNPTPPNPNPTPSPAPTPSITITPSTNTSSDKNVPSIDGDNGKSGWQAISEEIVSVREGGTVKVDMNGATELPKNIAEEIAGKDIDLVLDMGSGISWTINGLGVENPRTVDLSVSKYTKNIPVDIVNNVSGESYTIQISLTHNGDFGFTAELSIDLGRRNNGLYASLYYYNKDAEEAELISEDKIAKDGTARFAFTHASDYVIAVNENSVWDSMDDVSAAAPGAAVNETVGSGDTAEKGGVSVLITVILISAGAGAAVLAAVLKRKRKSDIK